MRRPGSSSAPPAPPPPPPRLERLAGLAPAARRPPDPGLEHRLANQHDPLAGDDEERHVVQPARVVRDEAVLDLGDLPLPREPDRLAEAGAERREHRLVDVHYRRRRSSTSPSGPWTTAAAGRTSSSGPSADATATRTDSSRPSSARKPS